MMENLLNGKIVKGIAGFYYVYVDEKGLFECKAKGLFRNKGIKPLVGDSVGIEIIDESERTGNIVKIDPRFNEIIRPACANIDQAVVVMSLSNPEPKFTLLDKILIFFQHYDIKVVICFNKTDEEESGKREYIESRYSDADTKIIYTSAKNNDGIDELLNIFQGKTSILTGPSGVGKSSILNRLVHGASKTGSISKIGRGRHTTRHSEIFNINDNTFVMDTPGFTALEVPDIDEKTIKYYFPEFEPYIGKCKFDECVHVNEPKCAVKEAVADGRINNDRYEGYKIIYESLKNRKKY